MVLRRPSFFNLTQQGGSGLPASCPRNQLRVLPEVFVAVSYFAYFSPLVTPPKTSVNIGAIFIPQVANCVVENRKGAQTCTFFAERKLVLSLWKGVGIFPENYHVQQIREGVAL